MEMKKFIKTAASAISALTVTSLSALTAFADDAASATSASTQQAQGNPITQLLVPLVIMFALLYFLFIRPQKKQDNQLREMRNSLEVGDEVITTGGIIGIVVRNGEDNVVIETGGERTKIRFTKDAIATNITANERMKDAKASGSKGVAAAKLTDDEEEAPKKSRKKKDSKDDSEE